jgi:hypothetical protein
MTSEEHDRPSAEAAGTSRRAILEKARQTAAASFQERVNIDPILAAQTILDPVGTLAKFGLVQPEDNDLSMQLTRGSLTDLVHVREAVEARGLVNAVRAPAHAAAAEAMRAGVEVTVCATLAWNSISVTACVTVRFEL